MKKLFSFLLAVLMCFCTMLIQTPHVYAAPDLNSVFEKLLDLGKNDREFYRLYLVPLLMNDGNIQHLIDQIEQADPEGGDAYSEKINSLLDSFGLTKEEAIQLIKDIGKIDVSIREEYLDVIKNKEAISLSSSLKDDMELLLAVLYQKYPSLQTLLEEDGYTSEVMANLLQALAELNDGEPLLTDDKNNKGNFAVKSVKSSFSRQLDPLLSDLGVSDTATLVKQFAAELNKLPSEQKDAVKRIGKKTGFYIERAEQSDPGGGTSGGDKPSDPSKTTPPPTTTPSASPKPTDMNGIQVEKVDVSVVSVALPDEAKVYSISLYQNGDKQELGVLPKETAVTVSVGAAEVMAYLVKDNKLSPMRYTVSNGNTLTMRIGETGYYAIVPVEKYFTDVEGWGSPYVEALYQRQIISGVSEHIFSPDSPVKREEFVKLAMELFAIPTAAGNNPFVDVAEGDWYYSYVLTAYQKGIINGVEATRFGTGENIKRQDLCKILFQLIQSYHLEMNYQKDSNTFGDKEAIADYAFESVDALYRLGIVSGDAEGNFNPDSYATRQEAAKIIYGVLELYVKSAK